MTAPAGVRYPDECPVTGDYPVGPGGSTVWPVPIDRRYSRAVVLTSRHRKTPDGSKVYGHRFPDGRHANTIANRTCTHCVVERELEYMHTMWAVEFDLPAPPSRRPLWNR